MAGKNNVWRGQALKRKLTAHEREQQKFDAETERLLKLAAQLAKASKKAKL